MFVTPRVLFVAQRVHWLQSRRSPRGSIAGKQCHYRQQRDRPTQRQRISRRHGKMAPTETWLQLKKSAPELELSRSGRIETFR